ncbi:hypothetical protein PO883_15045 [Massilia sp. DJPM01]|uniref:hypothetical protein n=1 Tax=Massilia sp. DJPM01 TaxID=3024404 RepID=UPI00259F6F1E|nr:hypothetical protein [Massilia sp. DJPM01]MDM5178513.1 hypothetical protein [Massilia sp. DJPM01]
MNINTEVDLAGLHATITAAIAERFPSLATVEFYREDREELPVPACILDLCEFEGEPSVDPGTGQLAVMARFEAELIIGFRTPEAKMSLRLLAGAFAAFLHKKRWPGGLTSEAEQIHAYKDDFKPALDQYEVWCVEWRQIIHLGESVWSGEGVTPTTIMLGFAPEVGFGHEDDYIQIAPEAA